MSILKDRMNAKRQELIEKSDKNFSRSLVDTDILGRFPSKDDPYKDILFTFDSLSFLVPYEREFDPFISGQPMLYLGLPKFLNKYPEVKEHFINNITKSFEIRSINNYPEVYETTRAMLLTSDIVWMQVADEIFPNTKISIKVKEYPERDPVYKYHELWLNNIKHRPNEIHHDDPRLSMARKPYL